MTNDVMDSQYRYLIDSCTDIMPRDRFRGCQSTDRRLCHPLYPREAQLLEDEGTWCSWLSRSLSIPFRNLREGSGSIPDVSIFSTLH